MTQDNKDKLGLYALISMCVGSMIGVGLFDLPQNVAYTTGIGASLIGWVITFFGMFCLAKVFQNLSDRCPELDAGVYAYAKEGLGDYLGFSSAWGYWVSAWLSNVVYVIALCSALSFFFPIFGDGTNVPSMILGSVVIWGITYLCIRRTKSASIINTVTTVAKIIPIVVFVAVVIRFFNYHTFTSDIWQIASMGSVMTQVKRMMLVTVWVFIGIEGANIFSARAKNRADVGKATIIGFLVVFFILFFVSALPFGVLSQSDLANLKTPSTSSLLFGLVGGWGSALMSGGLVISVLGAFLAWTLITAEVPFIAGNKDGLFPKAFTIVNKAQSPVGSLIIMAICQQVYLIIAHFYHSGYLATLLLATSMILLPYLFSAIYALMVTVSGKNYLDVSSKERKRDLLISVFAVIYGVWLIYASGVKYLLLSSVLYSIGNIVFIANKKQRQQKVFRRYELVLCIIFTGLGVACIFGLVGGKISL